MKKYLVFMIVGLMCVLPLTAHAKTTRTKSAHAKASYSKGERLWLLGRILDNGRVITVELVNAATGTAEAETSTNKFGHFAFSGEGKGNPSNYILRIYAGDGVVKEVGMSGVRTGGRLQEIRLH